MDVGVGFKLCMDELLLLSKPFSGHTPIFTVVLRPSVYGYTWAFYSTRSQVLLPHPATAFISSLSQKEREAQVG